MALKAVGIELHDHLVIGRKANASFKPGAALGNARRHDA